MSYKIVLSLLSLFYLNIIYTFSFDFKINLKLIDSNIDCGGPIIKNDNIEYPPCKSFSDLGNRIRMIDDISDDSVLNIFILVDENDHDINEIQDIEYLGSMMKEFNQIEIKVINNNNNQLIINNKILIDGSLCKYFINISASASVSNSIIRIYGLKFINWDSNSIIISNGYNIYLENIEFNNSLNILQTNNNNKGLSLNNCQINNINNINNNIQLSNINNIIFSNCNISNNKLNSISFNSGHSVYINQLQFNNNIINNYSHLIAISDYNNTNITNLIINNNQIPSLISTIYTLNEYSTIKLNSIQFNNNLITGSEDCLFNFNSFYNSSNIILNDIYIDINHTLDLMIKYSSGYGMININNLTSLNQNSFNSIINVDKSAITIINSSIPSHGSFISGSFNNITINNSIYNSNNNDKLITDNCNIINNKLKSKCNNSNKDNSSTPKSNKIIAIVLPVVLFTIILIVSLGVLFIYIKKKKIQQQQKKQNKKNKQNNIINEIEYEDSGATDNEIANHGSDQYIQNFFNDPDDSNGTTE